MVGVSLGGGLDVELIVSQLIHAERAPARTLETQRAVVSARTRALDDFEAKLEQLRASVDPLRDTAALAARTATSSAEDLVAASAAAGAQTGSFSLEVTALASTHALASAGFASLDEVIPTGSFDITVDGTTTTIDVAAGTTLEQLRDQIASSAAGVDAAVVFDGSAYRLSLTSQTGGLAGAITVDNFSSAPLQAALSFSETRAAADAAFKLNGLSMTRGSNSVSDAIDGVTFDLKALGIAEVSIASDPEAAVEAVRAFVDSYNSLTLHVQSQLRSGTAPSGPLARLSSVRYLQDQLRALVSGSVSGLDGDLVNLRQVGLKLQNDGTITIDETALEEAIGSDGILPLFRTSGRTTDSRVRFGAAAAQTEAGTYAVEVTQAAERAQVTAAATVPGSGIEQAETLTFTRGAISVDVALAKDMLIGDVIDTVNTTLAGTGIDVTASDDGSGRLLFTTTDYGSAATVDVVSDTDANNSTGVGTAGLSGTGVDVAGTIGGLAATGTGRTLLASEGDPAGLSIEVLATAAEIDPAGTPLGDVVVSHGIAESLGRLLDAELGSSSGSLAAERSGLSSSDRIIQDRIEAIDRRLATRQAYLTQQLSRADQALRQTQVLLQSMQMQMQF